MLRSLAMFQVFGPRSPVQRVLALDGGSRRFKLLLAESEFGRLRILREEMIDLQAEGLVSPEEIKTHLQASLDAWERPPLALVLPQHLSISQIIDLPLAPESEVDKLIAEETIKLSGVSESRIVYDFVRTATPAQNRQQFWVTLARESEVRDRIERLGLEPEELCEVTTTANALITSFRTVCEAPRAILIHMGAQTTVVVILLEGQGAFATSFQMGGDFFTRALARAHTGSEQAAENLKRAKDLLTGPEAAGEFLAAVDGWVAELKRQLSEWFQANPSLASGTPSFEIFASGGPFDQPGLLAYLQTKAALPLLPWPQSTTANIPTPAKGFEIAFGTALQALGHSPQPVSLLPGDYRQAWRKRLARQRLEVASLVLLVVCLLLLGLGTWRQLSLISSKSALLDKVRAGQRAFNENEALTSDLVNEYENLRPVLAAQQNSIDTLKTLSLLQLSRSNRGFWYVLLADQQSYFSQPPAALLATNRPAKTNLLGASLEAPRSSLLALRASAAAWTNMLPYKPGYIAELCAPGDAEASRQTLSDLVNGLKQQRLFSKVDLLSDDLRRSLAEPKVTVSDRDYVLALDFAEMDFQQPARWRKPQVFGPPRPAPRRAARPAWVGPETALTNPVAPEFR